MHIERNKKVQSTRHLKPILTDVFYREDGTRKPIVIFCHGYKGYKDWGAWNQAAGCFAEAGLFFVKFNFSHNGGTPEQPIDFPDLEAFGNNNYSLEMADLNDLLDWVLEHPAYQDDMDTTDLTLIGHSRGGGIVTLKASQDHRVTRLITWSGVSDFSVRFPKADQLEQWKKDGVMYVLNGRTGQQMPHRYQFYEDFKQNEPNLNIQKAAENIHIPHMIIHGTDDQVILPEEARNLHSWSNQSTLVFIEDMNHPLGCTQPWENPEMPIHLAEAVQHSISFILKTTR
jgi:pimeloyl-ACP methyl ester carboxylesterase